MCVTAYLRKTVIGKEESEESFFAVSTLPSSCAFGLRIEATSRGKFPCL